MLFSWVLWLHVSPEIPVNLLATIMSQLTREIIHYKLHQQDWWWTSGNPSPILLIWLNASLQFLLADGESSQLLQNGVSCSSQGWFQQDYLFPLRGRFQRVNKTELPKLKLHSFYNLVSEVKSHYFCYISFIKSNSLNPAQGGRNYTIRR